MAACDEPWTGIDLSLSLTTFVLSGQQNAIVDSAFGFTAPLAQPSYAGILWKYDGFLAVAFLIAACN